MEDFKDRQFSQRSLEKYVQKTNNGNTRHLYYYNYKIEQRQSTKIISNHIQTNQINQIAI
jgi:hypothetical protein